MDYPIILRERLVHPEHSIFEVYQKAGRKKMGREIFYYEIGFEEEVTVKRITRVEKKEIITNIEKLGADYEQLRQILMSHALKRAEQRAEEIKGKVLIRILNDYRLN